MKILLVFDFDNTIIDDNSDTWIVQCAPDQKLPIELQDSYQKGFWTEFMGRVFKYLGNEGVGEDEMKRTMLSMPFTPGVVELFNFIRENKDKFDCIIISDSNSVFIDWILEAADFHDVFDNVFTNPAAFDSNGHLTVENYHAHSCDRCPKNLCKNVVLVEFVDKQLKQGVNYTQIVYVGDGGNDLCPVTFLKKDDIAMPRKGYTLHKTLSKMSQNLQPVESSVVIWSSGVEIISHLQSLIKE
ncbi:PREDICTED: pyridoxal phosphate phosphatase PHOSPHO2 [Dipodomys ordii]|uniref:Pyridoxal phosphate phosphatase PHOSPHO2 n=1 Tax=Dipodomys ordii TaxID=10020 RepID=A0A1S3G2F1_DIPOR|nr:PREDICTED: pyridoxal phosphate phosphatase PHOSPHO2 [Dipodomys ordii]XP_012882469.1 PREDICTED: pyridoxal phosphate phosphatase PHOSPHO2 [Dipodomys ordii]XP_012882477.1 PREDICTED: pyridoxal phosphate phosphatase PHOSPHO2 [Dipodomys ordii]XP_042550072.1 pyridoxal phosphate phosphatase PHOSPHO2 [Dipodomys spectabilis]XP_042550073.1 pyridoxal phosphate phosphatase PHOSPHO2 [Dipodomys spectabilis]